MASLSTDTIVGVLGAGAMGTGIAQVAATYGHSVVLMDANEAALERAAGSLSDAMARQVEKGKRTQADADAILGRIDLIPGENLKPLAKCGLVIEAIIESLAAKLEVFSALEGVVEPDAVLATNTSSLSIGSIAAPCERGGRVCGVHFFNPAPVMPLVEIVPWLASDDDVIADVTALIDGWGKTTVVAADTPGFIVNRIARPFYGESIRCLEEGVASVETIDWAMRDVGGFRMGPFELMDFIGLDVNYAVTCSVYDGFFQEPRYRPSQTQRRYVEAGFLGRKSEQGFYDYFDGAEQREPVKDRALGERIRDRVVAMLINEAVDALFLRVASAADIEVAMLKGVNYPKGLLAWCDELGAATVLARLDALYDEYREDRYRASPLLRRLVRDNRPVLA